MNKRNTFNLCLLFVLLVLSQCKVSYPDSKVSARPDSTAIHTAKITELPNEVVLPNKIYRRERTRYFDLVHTKLEVRFDWKKQYLYGVATIELVPHFYPQDHLVLDAKGFEIHSVELVEGDSTKKLQFTYDSLKLDIDLAETCSRDQHLFVKIDYTAMPNKLKDHGGVAITSDKGLFFINPLGKEGNKPQEIWTQGETESSSCWFPTIDAPNQRCTQEMYITVQNKFKTLSNGLLVYSKLNGDSTRTDYWKMDLPHAPYLFMMAVGNFAVVHDQWKDIDVDYYVDTAYKAYAKDIFGHTPEMIGYFSDLLHYPFPWPKYSQVVVHDYVSGAMENTTASLFMEDLQVDKRSLIDYNWDDIIAHELFHHWFGDLVTCESWSNLPLNEGFATYAEYLWENHRFGKQEADYHLYEELRDYLADAENKEENVIRFYYDKPDNMFDDTSYGKTGLILNMLRHEVGDEAFFRSLEYYLKQHAFSSVEIQDLRLAFEHVTGRDLNWFFNEWFLAAGHPKLKVQQAYDDSLHTLTLKVWQTQDTQRFPVYKLPLSADVWVEGHPSIVNLDIEDKYQEFKFSFPRKPSLVLLDQDYALVGEIDRDLDDLQYLKLYEYYPKNARARLEALQYFVNSKNDSLSDVVVRKALADPFWKIREQALDVYDSDTLGRFGEVESKIVKIASSDPKSLVRADAISVLTSKDKEKYKGIFKNALNDSSYAVLGAALYGYLQTDSEDKDAEVSRFMKYDNSNIVTTLADYFAQSGDYTRYDWFVQKIGKSSGSDLWYLLRLFGMYLMKAPDDQAQKGAAILENIARNHYQYYNRLSAYQSLELLTSVSGVDEALKDIRQHETDKRVKDYLNN